MPQSPKTFRPPGAPQRQSEREYDSDRGSAHARGYDARWKRASKQYLSEHPLCEYCEQEGLTALATLVDHLYPHNGDRVVFWRSEWWVASCAACHNGMKQAIERLGRKAIDALARRLGRLSWPG